MQVKLLFPERRPCIVTTWVCFHPSKVGILYGYTLSCLISESLCVFVNDFPWMTVEP